MLAGITHSIVDWASEVNEIISREVVDLEPHEYCVFGVVVIAIGHVMLRK